MLFVAIHCVRKDGARSLHAVLLGVGMASLSGDCWIAVFAVLCWQVIDDAEVCSVGLVG